MPRYGTLGDYRFSNTQDAADDIRGAKVYGPNDEKLGEIDDVIFDQATGGIVYVVVDTGGWLSSHKFLVPPERIRPSLQHQDDFLVDLTKEQIKGFPPYDSAALGSDELWADYEKRYRSKWVDGPVMHRAGTDRNITPTTDQQIGGGSGTISPANEDDDLDLDDEELEVTPITTDATMDISPSGPSLRWTTFEDKLRQRREEVLDASIKDAERRKAS